MADPTDQTGNPPSNPFKPSSDLFEQSAFPVSTRTKDRQGIVFEHQVEGGMTILAYVAVELLKGYLSNPGLINPQVTSAGLRQIALREAASLLKDLEDLRKL